MGLMQRMFGRGNAPELPPPSYSNAAVIERIEREEDVDRDTARAWFDEMLIFLDLCARSDKVLAPPVNVDRAWHAFLLHSRDYEAYCNGRFGRLIHHQPTGEPDSEAYRRGYDARQRYASSGVAADPYLWAVPASTAGGGGEDKDEDDRSDGGDDGRDDSPGSSDSASDAGGGSDSGGGGDSGGGSSCGGGGCGGGGS